MIYSKTIQYYELYCIVYINNNIVGVPQIHSYISLGRSVCLLVSQTILNALAKT